jgi:hypothetical protein
MVALAAIVAKIGVEAVQKCVLVGAGPICSVPHSPLPCALLTGGDSADTLTHCKIAVLVYP